MKLKATEPLSEQDQAELDEITDKLFDLEEQLESFGKEPEQKQDQEPEQKQEPEPEPEPTKKPEPPAPVIEQRPKQREDVLRLKIQVGKRFSADTGKEINPPFEQTYTRSEWNNFKQHYAKCGYKVAEVVYDPWGEATQMFGTSKK
jgi:hypothetical protein